MKVATGARVTIHYRGTLDDGEEFDSSDGREPLEFTVGQGAMIPGFEEAVVGMEPGQEKTFTLEPEDAYGAVDSELVIEGPRDRFPAEVTVGQSYHLHLAGGQEADAVVKEVRKDAVLLDFNHPLAGKRLTFYLKVLKAE